MKEKPVARKNAGKTTPAVAAPSVQYNRKPSWEFLPHEGHQNEFTISPSKKKGQR